MREPSDPPEAGVDAMANNSPDHATAPPVLGERYRLEGHIASGGMASVWRARDEALARTVAIKLLHDHLSRDDAFRERFRREAIAAAKLTHPGIVSMYDTGSDGTQTWLVMELVEGPTLRDVMDDVGVLPPAQAASIGEKVARALAYAHDHGLVHRDVKPANILLGHDGVVKVADFGIAKAEETPSDLTRTGAVLGTAAYVAPEQILGEPLGGACDQYALGCVLFEALTGQRPFRADSPLATAAQRLDTDALPIRAVRSELPPALEPVIARALARRPEDRYPSSAQLADDLAAFAEEQPLALAAAAWPGADDGAGGPSRAPARPAARVPSERRAPGLAQRRWAVPLIAVLLTAIGGLLALLGSGVLDVGPFADRGGGKGTSDGSTLVAPTGVTLFDPGGTGSEHRNRDELSSLLDGDPSTHWDSVGYSTPAFGGLKPGLGFWLDLGTPHALHSVALRTTTPGVSYEIRIAEEPAPTLGAWQPVGSTTDAAALSQVGWSEPVTSQYVLVWITGDLQPDGSGRYRAGFSDLAIRGTKP